MYVLYPSYWSLAFLLSIANDTLAHRSFASGNPSLLHRDCASQTQLARTRSPTRELQRAISCNWLAEASQAQAPTHRTPTQDAGYTICNDIAYIGYPVAQYS